MITVFNSIIKTNSIRSVGNSDTEKNGKNEYSESVPLHFDRFLLYCFIDLSSLAADIAANADVYFNKSTQEATKSSVEHFIWMFRKFFSATKLNRFIRLGSPPKMGRKSHQFCILFGIYLKFWLVILSATFFFSLAPISYCKRQWQQQRERQRRRPRLHFNSYFCGWLHPEKDKAIQKQTKPHTQQKKNWSGGSRLFSH